MKLLERDFFDRGMHGGGDRQVREVRAVMACFGATDAREAVAQQLRGALEGGAVDNAQHSEGLQCHLGAQPRAPKKTPKSLQF